MRFTLVLLSAFFCLNAAAEYTEKTGDDALVAEAEKLVSDEAAKDDIKSEIKLETAAPIATASTEDKAIAKSASEAEIPVLVESKKEAKSQNGLMFRLFGSLALIALIAGGTIFASRRFKNQKTTGGSKTRIETLHQVHFGPRKSLALVRIAGEVMLIGLTDQNITMLKQVMLIDDELENAMGGDFNKYLQDDFAIEDVRNAISRN